MNKYLPPITCSLCVCLWIYALGWAFAGYPVYRDQHLGAALHYATSGIDLLRPVIPGFNATGTGTPQELPLWQACAAWALRIGNGWWGAATIISLLLFTLSLPFFWLPLRAEFSSPIAWLGLAFLLTQPVVFHLAGGAQTEGLALALLFFFIWSSENLRKQIGWGTFMLCAMSAVLLSLTKLPFLIAGGLAAIFRLVFCRETSRSNWLLLSLAGFVSILFFYLWNQWCEQEIQRALFRYKLVTLKEMPEWFFGSWAFRLDPINYLKAGWRALGCLWGSFVLVGLTFYGLYKNPRSLGACLFYGCILTTLIFTHLVFVHHHYYLMFAPAVAYLNTSAIFAAFPNPKKWVLAIIVPLLLLSLAQGLISINAVACGDPYNKRVGALISSNSSPQEKLMVLSHSWGGEAFLHSGRAGLSVEDSSLAENPETLARLRRLGYTKFVWISESPLLYALRVTNPGEAERKRGGFPVHPPISTSNWHPVYESDEVVIKALPAQ